MDVYIYKHMYMYVGVCRQLRGEDPNDLGEYIYIHVCMSYVDNGGGIQASRVYIDISICAH